MAKDLRTFIKQIESEHPDDLRRVTKEVDPANYDVTAVMEHLYRRGERPAVLFEHPKNLKGDASDIPVLINVFAERARCATALDFPREQSNLPVSLEFSRLSEAGIGPVTVGAADAPVKEVVLTGDTIDTRELPIVIHEYLDVLFDREGRADAIFVSSSNDLLDADRQLSTFYQAGGVGSSNTDEELSALIDQAGAELDPEGRTPIYNEALQVAYDQAYLVWLVNNKDLYGLSDRVEWTPRVDSKLLVKEMSVSG